MNDADIDKLHNALAITVNVEANLTNFLSRSSRAGKFWAAWLKTNKGDAAKVTNMKDALSALAKLMKDAKTVLKDLDKATKQVSSKQALAKYPTGKAYRDTVLTKQLASLRAWEQNGTRFITSMNKVVSPFPYPKSPASLADVMVTYDSVKGFLERYGDMKKELAKL